jgi:hypothetical protein
MTAQCGNSRVTGPARKAYKPSARSLLPNILLNALNAVIMGSGIVRCMLAAFSRAGQRSGQDTCYGMESVQRVLVSIL